MKKTIYHGSDHIIEKPQYGYGKPYNDYGVGFYCTENPNMAKEWGVSIDHNGYANEYQIECDGLTILDLNAPEYTMLHWLTILLENREFDASTPLAAETKDYLLQNFHLDYKTADPRRNVVGRDTHADGNCGKRYARDLQRQRMDALAGHAAVLRFCSDKQQGSLALCMT